VRLKVKILGINAGDKPIVVLNEEDAEDIGVRSLGRVSLKDGGKEMVAVLNTTKTVVQKGYVGVFDELVEELGLKENMQVEVIAAEFPRSIQHIKAKIEGRKLKYDEIYEIVKDVVDGKLSRIEIAAFVTSLNTFGLDVDEAVRLSQAMYETGDKLDLKNAHIVDKHSIGGVPGDKTTILVVPIIAACGVTIPKTSSRAITSAAGTADRAEVLMPVELNLDEMRTVVRKTHGCIVWGGTLKLAPADDIFIQVEYPLSIDPMLLPSIMSKKKSVGAEYLVIDIPTGRGAKVKTIGEADVLAKDFIEMGNRMGIKVQCAVSYGEQPIGYTVGPALEAREVLEVIMRKRNVPDLLDKAKTIAAMILEMIGKDGKKLVDKVFKEGDAERKLREIIFEQGGDAEIQPEDIEIGKYGLDVHAERNGNVMWIDNRRLVSIARAAGAPKDNGAGIQLYKKVGEKAEKDKKIFTIYAESPSKLKRAKEVLEQEDVVYIGERRDMVIHHVREHPINKKAFIFER
jgi:AMP phosphorylase